MTTRHRDVLTSGEGAVIKYGYLSTNITPRIRFPNLIPTRLVADELDHCGRATARSATLAIFQTFGLSPLLHDV